MTIVFEGGSFWIDCIFIARTTLAAGVSDVIAFNVVRGGHVVGISTNMDCDIADCVIGVRRRNDSFINHGQEINNEGVVRSLELVRHNFNAGDAELGGQVLIFFRS